MKIKRPSRQKSMIDMTPVIDVVFQLLTFFMITSTVIKTSAINVDLPSSRTSDAQPILEAVITLYKNGSVTLNDEPITLDKVGPSIRDLYLQENELVVTIRGDQGIPYGTLIDVMDTVRMTGVKRMSLATTLRDD